MHMKHDRRQCLDYNSLLLVVLLSSLHLHSHKHSQEQPVEQCLKLPVTEDDELGDATNFATMGNDADSNSETEDYIHSSTDFEFYLQGLERANIIKEAGLPTYLNRDSDEHELERELVRTPTNGNGSFRRTNNLSDEEEVDATQSEAGCSLTLYNGGNHDTIYDKKTQKETGLPTYLNGDSDEHELEWEVLQTRTRTRTQTGANSNSNTNGNGSFRRTNNLSDKEEMEKEFWLLNAWRQNGFLGF
ncbi:hypothetical protein JHK84_043508 [Glycine max]|nr:hypothetical protein JHK84_043508 [Glycine max]